MVSVEYPSHQFAGHDDVLITRVTHGRSLVESLSTLVLCAWTKVGVIGRNMPCLAEQLLPLVAFLKGFGALLPPLYELNRQELYPASCLLNDALLTGRSPCSLSTMVISSWAGRCMKS